jgi:hypothetical protein
VICRLFVAREVSCVFWYPGAPRPSAVNEPEVPVKVQEWIDRALASPTTGTASIHEGVRRMRFTEDYKTYFEGSRFINFLLGPATVA